MKLVAKQMVKFGGEHLPAGTVFEADKDIAKTLMEVGAAVEAGASEKASPSDPGVLDLTKIDGVNKSVAKALIKSGVDTVAKLKAATKEQLMSVPGIGEALAERIMEEVAAFGD